MKKPKKPERDKKKPTPSPANPKQKRKDGHALSDDDLDKVSGGLSDMGVKDHSV